MTIENGMMSLLIKTDWQFDSIKHIDFKFQSVFILLSHACAENVTIGLSWLKWKDLQAYP